VRTTGLVWLVFNVLHLSYHLTMLGMYGRTDQVLNVIGLSWSSCRSSCCSVGKKM
jgi:hypothetical protein